MRKKGRHFSTKGAPDVLLTISYGVDIFSNPPPPTFFFKMGADFKYQRKSSGVESYQETRRGIEGGVVWKGFWLGSFNEIEPLFFLFFLFFLLPPRAFFRPVLRNRDTKPDPNNLEWASFETSLSMVIKWAGRGNFDCNKFFATRQWLFEDKKGKRGRGRQLLHSNPFHFWWFAFFLNLIRLFYSGHPRESNPNPLSLSLRSFFFHRTWAITIYLLILFINSKIMRSNSCVEFVLKAGCETFVPSLSKRLHSDRFKLAVKRNLGALFSFRR